MCRNKFEVYVGTTLRFMYEQVSGLCVGKSLRFMCRNKFEVYLGTGWWFMSRNKFEVYVGTSLRFF